MGLRIGTSGWSYPTGKGKWNGVFYPATRSKRLGTAGFDELRFYAEHFPQQRRINDRGRRAVAYDLAFVHHNDAVREARRHGEVMQDRDHRDA